MQGSLRLLPPDEVFGWECVYCLEENKIIQRRLPGYFTSGTCWICGFETSFLQLVIRRKGA